MSFVCPRNEWDSLGRNLHGGHVERLKPGLRHALSVRIGGSQELCDFLHVGPIRDDTVLTGILQHVVSRNSRGPARVAIAAGEFSHVADL